MKYHASKYIAFDAGRVIVGPMARSKTSRSLGPIANRLTCPIATLPFGPLALSSRYRTRSSMLRRGQFGSTQRNGLPTISFPYFETHGKMLDPEPTGSASEDLNGGFCDVSPKFKPANRCFAGKLHSPSGFPTGSKHAANTGPKILEVVVYRNRTRNDLYDFRYAKAGLWIHGDRGCMKDTELELANPAATIESYRVNPHRLTRATADHFLDFVAKIKADAALKNKFPQFFNQSLES